MTTHLATSIDGTTVLVRYGTVERLEHGRWHIRKLVLSVPVVEHPATVHDQDIEVAIWLAEGLEMRRDLRRAVLRAA